MKMKLSTILLLLASVAIAAPTVTTIQIKRGLEANLPASAKMGELLFTTDTHRVFVGNSTSRLEIPKTSEVTTGLAGKVNTSTFSAYTGLGVPLATTIDASGTASFPTAATIYSTYSSTVRKAGTATGGGSFASITGQPTDNSNLATALNAKASTAYVDAAVSGVSTGSLPQSADDTGKADGASWINTTTKELVTRIGNTIYSVAMSLKTTLAAILGLDSGTADFGTVNVGTESGHISRTLSNSGTATATGIAFANTSSAVFRNFSSTCGSTLAVSANCSFKTAFTPTAAGAKSGHINITADGGLLASLAMSGTGVAVANFSDNFNRADENPLSNGGVWAKPTYASAVRIVSNRANGSTAAAQNIAYRSDWTGNDQCSEIKLQQVNNNQGPAVRISPTVDSFYWIQAPDPLTVKRRVTGTETTIIASATSSLVDDRVKICASGTTISIYKNDTLVDSVTDTNITAGYPGFRMTQNTDYMDDSVVSAP